MMTKRDFEEIASVLNANFADLPVVLDMADMLGENNPRFDRQQFVRAATLFLNERAQQDARILAIHHGMV